MGRQTTPTTSAPAVPPQFRFLPSEVAEMEACLQQLGDGVTFPSRAVLQTLADRFSASPERAGKVVIQPKQVWNWFQNRRYSFHRIKTSRLPPLPPAKMPADRHHQVARPYGFRAPQPFSVGAAQHGSSSGKNPVEGLHQLEFEAKSARDGAWYDVLAFLSYRLLESGDPTHTLQLGKDKGVSLLIAVRLCSDIRGVHIGAGSVGSFSGLRAEDDEWINVRNCMRQRSLPCDAKECVAVLPGDLVLCFQEGKQQALYFDAHVIDVHRRRHDARGCRCRFLVRYDHDSSEEIVQLRKLCRRPETDYRLPILHAAGLAATKDIHTPPKAVIVELASNDKIPVEHKSQRQHKKKDVNTGEGAIVSSLQQEGTPGKAVAPLLSATSETMTKELEASSVVEDADEVEVVDKMKEV